MLLGLMQSFQAILKNVHAQALHRCSTLPGELLHCYCNSGSSHTIDARDSTRRAVLAVAAKVTCKQE